MNLVASLNMLHLRSFWVVAREMSTTAAAKRLNVSQSTLSTQIRLLEDSLGTALFERRKQRLHLTEAGRQTLDYAEEIFSLGRELWDTVRLGQRARQRTLRVGAVGYLSKNLQYDLIEPALRLPHVRLSMIDGTEEELREQLREPSLDLLLTNRPLRTTRGRQCFNHLLGELPVFLVGRGRAYGIDPAKLPDCLADVPLFLPGRESMLRHDFESWLEGAGVRPLIRAEVDDMALLRLFALSGHGLALVPEIVVEHEIRRRAFAQLHRVPGVTERFYAVTANRRLRDPLVAELIEAMRARFSAVV